MDRESKFTYGNIKDKMSALSKAVRKFTAIQPKPHK